VSVRVSVSVSVSVSASVPPTRPCISCVRARHVILTTTKITVITWDTPNQSGTSLNYVPVLVVHLEVLQWHPNIYIHIHEHSRSHSLSHSHSTHTHTHTHTHRHHIP